MGALNQDKLIRVLLAIFIIEWIVLAIEPNYRSDWVLENVLVVVYFGLMVWLRRHVRFSNTSYVLMFVFMVIHEIGAHYTYAEVPYNDWFKLLTGQGFNDMVGFERNHFDRLAHFAYGLLLFLPLHEVFSQTSNMSRAWCNFVTLDIIMSLSMLYELIEWGAAEIFGGELGMAYLGTQGDIWDAHKDMALACLGGVVALLLMIYWQRRQLTMTQPGLTEQL